MLGCEEHFAYSEGSALKLTAFSAAYKVRAAFSASSKRLWETEAVMQLFFRLDMWKSRRARSSRDRKLGKEIYARSQYLLLWISLLGATLIHTGLAYGNKESTYLPYSRKTKSSSGNRLLSPNRKTQFKQPT